MHALEVVTWKQGDVTHLYHALQSIKKINQHYTLYSTHLFTIDPTHFGLNGHHQGSLQYIQKISIPVPYNSVKGKVYKHTLLT